MASLEPKTDLLGKHLAAHLLRRATFGPNRQEIDAFAEKTPTEAVDELFSFPPLPDHPVDPQTGETWVISGRTGANSDDTDLHEIVNAWWMHQVLNPTLPISAFTKVHFFLHTSFSTSWQEIKFSENHYYTLRLLMHYVSGSYKDLAFKICLDGGMNEYLDIGESKRGNPNENFAREFFELFTIGKGPQIAEDNYTNFTEDDIRAAARLLTGFRLNTQWDDPLNLDPETGMPRAVISVDRHDLEPKEFSSIYDSKIILGRDTEEGMLEELQEFVDMIFEKNATAISISKRIYRFFVRTEISDEVMGDIIIPMANILRTNDYNILAPIKRLLSSKHFYDEDNANTDDEIVGALIKSPLELQIGTVRFLKVIVPDPTVDAFESYVSFYKSGLIKLLSNACFDLFAPPDVAGYEPVFQPPEYNRLWISAKSIPARYSLTGRHVDGDELLSVDILAFVMDKENISDFEGPDPAGVPGPHPGPRIGSHLVQELVDYLLPMPIDNERFSYFLNELLLDNLSEMNWMNEFDLYNTGGDDSVVRELIQRLVIGILQSPEFQLG